jgi:hypothetical protein
MSINPWPAELDALVASAEHHKLLFENQFVRVLEVRILPGEKTNIHTHQWPATIYSLSRSAFIRHDPEGRILLQSGNMEAPFAPAFWSDPIPPHTLTNTGDNEIRNICVEIKNSGGNTF